MLRVFCVFVTFWALGSHANPITYTQVQSGELTLYEGLIGRISLNEEKLSHINPRYPGIVSKVFVEIGEKVQKGQSLARIQRNNGLQSFTLVAASSGTIIEKNLSVGASVDTSHRAFSICDLSSLWVEVSIKPAYLDKITVNQDIVISAHGNKIATGRVFYRSPFIDSETRTATILLEIPNHEGQWIPGMFVDAHLPSAKQKVDLFIPLSAIKTLGKKNSIVVVHSDNGPEVREINIGKRDLENAEVKTGLRAGEKIYTNFPEQLLVNVKHTPLGHEESESENHPHKNHEHIYGGE